MTMLSLATPELFLAAAGLMLLLYGVLRGDGGTRGVVILTVLAFVLALGLVAVGGHGAAPLDGTAFHGMFITDGFARYMKICVLIASMFALVMAAPYYLDREDLARPEYPVLMLFATLGMLLMVSANDLMALYVGLELQSLSLYVLAAFRRDHARSSEAGLKYFVLGALSSGLLLYGASLIYGTVGATNFHALAEAVTGEGQPPVGMVIGLVFLVAGLAFKLSAVPFHMWTPDVFEGAPTSVTAFFATAPKLAAMALMARLLVQPLEGMMPQWQQIILTTAMLSMILGGFAALMQENVKRLMAYSSIANIGTALVGLGVGGEPGLQGMLIYLTIYFVNTIGVFGVILCLRRRGRMVETITDFAGMSRTHPRLALMMVIFMFSLAGIPPLAGFFAKYFVFLAAVKAGYVAFAIVGVVISTVAAYYCLRIIKVMYFDETDEVSEIDPAHEFTLRAITGTAALAMTVFWIVPMPVVNGALAAARSLLQG